MLNIRKNLLFVSQDNSYFQIYAFINAVNPLGRPYMDTNHGHRETTR